MEKWRNKCFKKCPWSYHGFVRSTSKQVSIKWFCLGTFSNKNILFRKKLYKTIRKALLLCYCKRNKKWSSIPNAELLEEHHMGTFGKSTHVEISVTWDLGNELCSLALKLAKNTLKMVISFLGSPTSTLDYKARDI